MAILISGFADTTLNGLYFSQGIDTNGNDIYRKTINNVPHLNFVYLIHHEKYANYCQTPAYYLMKLINVEGAIPIHKPVAVSYGSYANSSSWITLTEGTSGTQTVGTSLLANSSSSSSSIDSSSSSSSFSSSSSSSSSVDSSSSSSSVSSSSSSSS